MDLVRENRLANKVVFVDGIGRSGKMFISNLISSFKNVEITRIDNSFDTIPKMCSCGEISRDAAIMNMRLEADIHLYENSICRCVNFRKDDASSIFKSPNPTEYIERLHLPDGSDAVSRIQDNGYIYQSITHDALTNIDLFIDAFKSDLRLIHCIRNPIDVVHSWHRKGFGDRIGSDPREFQLTKKWKDTAVPIDVDGWEDEYLKCNEYERIVGLIHKQYTHNMNMYNTLNDIDVRRVFILKMRKFKNNPMKMTKKF